MTRVCQTSRVAGCEFDAADPKALLSRLDGMSEEDMDTLLN